MDLLMRRKAMGQKTGFVWDADAAFAAVGATKQEDGSWKLFVSWIGIWGYGYLQIDNMDATKKYRFTCEAKSADIATYVGFTFISSPKVVTGTMKSRIDIPDWTEFWAETAIGTQAIGIQDFYGTGGYIFIRNAKVVEL